MPPSKKKEKKPRYLSRKAAAVFMALVILAAGGLGVGGGILGYQLAKGSGSGSGVNITTVQPSSGENTNAVNYTGDSMSVSDVAAMTSPSVVEITTEAVTTDIYMQQYVQTGAGSGVSSARTAISLPITTLSTARKKNHRYHKGRHSL